MVLPDLHIIQISLVILLMVGFFIFEIFPMEVTALAGISLLVFCGILDYEEAISGFGSKAVIVIAAIFVISRSLVKTGFLEVATDYFYKLAGTSKWLTLTIFYFSVSLISGFINNTAAVSIFIPLAMNLAHKFHISPTKILLPLSYAAIFGGTLTLIGTSTNIIVNNYVMEHNLSFELRMFDFVPLGSLFLIVGIIYNLILSKWILPSRAITSSLTQKYHLRTFLTEYKITSESSLCNSSFKNQNKKKFSIQLLKIIRGKNEIVEDLRTNTLKEGDIIIVQVNTTELLKVRDEFNLLLLSDIKIDQQELAGSNYVIVEGLIPQYSSLINKTIGKIDFRRKLDSFVLAIQRQTELLRGKVAHVLLKFSDTLLIMVPKNKLERLKENKDLIILEELELHLKSQKYWWLSILILPLIMVISYWDPSYFIPATLFGCVLLLALRSISIESAYESINWQVIFMIAMLIPLGIAMEKDYYHIEGSSTVIAEELIMKEIIVDELSGNEVLNKDGENTYNYYIKEGEEFRKIEDTVTHYPNAAQEISTVILEYISGREIYFIIAVLYLITFISSAFMSNAAVAIILSPIAIKLGIEMALVNPLDPDPTKAFLMAICFGASASFMTPIGYQTNLMVFGPGQYKFKDFLIAGIPITLVFWAIAIYFIPKFYL